MPVGALIGIAIASALGEIGTSIYQASASSTAQKKAAGAQADALAQQKAEQAKLNATAAAAPEQERLDALEQRRKRVQTLLTNQQDTGMATVGTKTLLGG